MENDLNVFTVGDDVRYLHPTLFYERMKSIGDKIVFSILY